MPKNVIKAKDPRLPLISVVAPSSLTTSPIPKGVFEVTLLSQYTAREATSSQPTIKEEEEEVVNVSDSEDDFEVFNLPSLSENSVGDLSLLPLAQVSCSQEDPTILEVMPIQRRTRQSL